MLFRLPLKYIIAKLLAGLLFTALLALEIGAAAAAEGAVVTVFFFIVGENAFTHYSVLKEYSNFSLVAFKLETGRTHQIRVHSKHIGHPILGDTLYGNSSELISRQALHACKVTFEHPIKHKKILCTSPIPADMQKILL